MYSIYGVHTKKGNIGHEAHLGGALAGMAIAVVFKPEALLNNYIPISIVFVLASAFLITIIIRPHILIFSDFFHKKNSYHTIEDKYHTERIEKINEIDSILEKIHEKGIDSLNKYEKDTLEQYSRKIK